MTSKEEKFEEFKKRLKGQADSGDSLAALYDEALAGPVPKAFVDFTSHLASKGFNPGQVTHGLMLGITIGITTTVMPNAKSGAEHAIADVLIRKLTDLLHASAESIEAARKKGLVSRPDEVVTAEELNVIRRATGGGDSGDFDLLGSGGPHSGVTPHRDAAHKAFAILVDKPEPVGRAVAGVDAPASIKRQLDSFGRLWDAMFPPFAKWARDESGKERNDSGDLVGSLLAVMANILGIFYNIVAVEGHEAEAVKDGMRHLERTTLAVLEINKKKNSPRK